MRHSAIRAAEVIPYPPAIRVGTTSNEKNRASLLLRFRRQSARALAGAIVCSIASMTDTTGERDKTNSQDTIADDDRADRLGGAI